MWKKRAICALLLAVLLDVMISFGLNKTDCYRYQTFSDIIKGDMRQDVLDIPCIIN